MKLKGLKSAVGDYQRANLGGWYDSRYGYLMLDLSTGEIWTDFFCSIGHNSWIEYHDKNIIRLDKVVHEYNIPVTMKNVKEVIADQEAKGWDILDRI